MTRLACDTMDCDLAPWRHPVGRYCMNIHKSNVCADNGFHHELIECSQVVVTSNLTCLCSQTGFTAQYAFQLSPIYFSYFQPTTSNHCTSFLSLQHLV